MLKNKRFFILIALTLFLIYPSSTLSNLSAIDYLVNGKKDLDSCNFVSAEKNLSKALLEIKEVGDYILLWRAKALIEMERYEEALKDLIEIKRNYPSSPILKTARIYEINILKKLDSPHLESAYKSYTDEYPEDLEIKFNYAQYLKQTGKIQKAKRIFKEIFITASPLADKAELELSEEDISVDDLLKKAKALNNSFLYNKAEKYLNLAMAKSKNKLQDMILWNLGYSVFMQKRYTESASIFKKIGDFYWYGRSLLRAKEFNSFEREIQNFIKSGDQKIGELLINYANIKRRNGDFNKAIEILQDTLNKYPSYREETLWYLGWNNYLASNYTEAKSIFRDLFQKYGNLKYLYWFQRAQEKEGIIEAKHYSFTFRPSDFYSYLLYVKGNISTIPKPEIVVESKTIPSRVKILMQANFKEEALRETKHLLKSNKDMDNIPLYCMLLNGLGDYATSVRLISKFPYGFNYQELLYPKVYYDLIDKFAKKLKLDPALIFAIIREESRFDRLAVSPAGAMGLMQLMPNTAKREAKKISINLINDRDLFEPDKNIYIGAFYLSKLINEFDNVVFAIAAYNAGEAVVNSWIRENRYDGIDEFIEDIPYGETRTYVKRVLTSYFEYLRTYYILTPDKIREIIKIEGV